MPLINYKEKTASDDKTVQSTSVTSIKKRVFDAAIGTARMYYSPLATQKTNDTLVIDGELTGSLDTAFEAIYNSVKNIRSVLIWTANNAEIVREALKEGERNKRYGINSKLYLRTQSMQEIEGMSRPQLQALLTDIMENIYYGDDFPETQRKFEVDKLLPGGAYFYKQMREDWKIKVGAM